MSPEQLRGYTVDPQTNLYALGASLFEALTAKRLHSPDGEPIQADVELHGLGTPELNHAILCSLEEDPKLRLVDTEAFQALLDAPPIQQSESEETKRQELVLGENSSSGSQVEAPYAQNEAHEFSKPVATLSIALILCAIFILAAGTWVYRAPQESTTAPVKSVEVPSAPIIALLPFTDKSEFAEFEFSKGGLPYLLGQELKRIPGVRVLGHYNLRAHLSSPDAPLSEWKRTAIKRHAKFLVFGELVSNFTGNIVDVRVSLENQEGVLVTQWSKKVTVRAVPKTVRAMSKNVARKILGQDVKLDLSPEIFEFQKSYLAGVEALEAHQVDNAFRHFKSAARINLHSGLAQYSLALTAWWAGKSSSQVARYAERAIAFGIDTPKELFLSGLSLLIERNHAASIKHFQKALKSYPEHRDLLYGYYESLFHGGEPAKALSVYRTIAKLHPSFRLGIMHALTFSILNGRNEDVAWALAQAKAQEDSNHRIWVLKAKIADGDRQAAAEELQVLSEQYLDLPSNNATLTMIRDTLVSTYAVMGQIDLALELLSEDQVVARYALQLARGSKVEKQDLVTQRDQLESHQQVQGVWLSFALIEWLQASSSIKPEVLESAQAVQLALLTGAKTKLPQHSQIEAIAAALQASKNGDTGISAVQWSKVATRAGDATYVTLAHYKSAEAYLSAKRWDKVIEHCEQVVDPKLFHWTWGQTVGPCLLWLSQSHLAMSQPEAAQRYATQLKRLRTEASPNDPLLSTLNGLWPEKL